MPQGAEQYIGKQELREVIYEDASKEAQIIHPEIKDLAERWDDDRPQIEDFQGLDDKYYTKEKILKDIEEVERKETELFDRPETKIGLIGEVIILEGLETEKWLPNVKESFYTCKDDDYKRGIDFVIRFKTESPKPIYLGIDLKTTRDKGKIRDRIRLIEEKLDKGELGQLKYFEDSGFPKKEDRIFGKLELPVIVLALDTRFALIMQQAIVKKIKKEKLSGSETKKEELVKNMMVIQLLTQLMELEMYFDKKQLSNYRQKKIQEKYREIIKEINIGVDVKALVEYLDQIIKITAGLQKESPDLFKNFSEYSETLQEYKLKNPDVAY